MDIITDEQRHEIARCSKSPFQTHFHTTTIIRSLLGAGLPDSDFEVVRENVCMADLSLRSRAMEQFRLPLLSVGAIRPLPLSYVP